MKTRAKAFSKIILGSKESTRMICHRLSMKVYANGIVIKPIGAQGIVTKGIGKYDKLRPQIDNQNAIFLTNENAEHLFIFLKSWNDKNKIVETLEKDNEKEGQGVSKEEWARY